MLRKVCLIGCMFLALACSKSGDNSHEPDTESPGSPGNPGNLTLSITSVSPERSESGVVTIKGTGFNSTIGLNEVQFGKTIASITSATPTQLVVTIPDNMPQGDHDITIFANNKYVTKTKGFHLIGWHVSTFAGTGEPGGIDGPGSTATFQWPTGMVLDAVGNIYVTDLNRIRKITPKGAVSTVAGAAGRGSVDANGVNARFNSVTSIVMDVSGNLYVADQMNFTIRKIEPNGDVSTIAGKAGEFGKSDGVGVDARFSMPYGIAINNAGTHLVVGDINNHMIRQIELATNRVTTIAGNGQQVSSDGKGLQAGIVGPGGMVYDKNGNLYITEKGGGKVRKMAPDGTVTTIGGSLSVNTMPTHAVIDEDNNLYITYSGMGKIKRYTPAGIETNFAGNNTGTGEEEGPAQSVYITRPEGIVTTIDNGKAIFYISDAYNKKIKKIVKD